MNLIKQTGTKIKSMSPKKIKSYKLNLITKIQAFFTTDMYKIFILLIVILICSIYLFTNLNLHYEKNAQAQEVFPPNTVCYTVADNGLEDGPDNLVKIYADGTEQKIGPTGTDRIEALTDGPDGFVFGINGVDLVKINRETANTEKVNTVGIVRGAIGDITPTDIDSIARDSAGFWVVERKRDRSTTPHTVTDYLIRLDLQGNIVQNQFGEGVDYVQVINNEYGRQNQSVDDIAYDYQGNLYGVGDILISGVRKDNLFKINTTNGEANSVGVFDGISDIEGLSIDPNGRFVGMISAQSTQYYDTIVDITGAIPKFPPVKAISPSSGFDFESLACFIEIPTVINSSTSSFSDTSLNSSSSAQSDTAVISSSQSNMTSDSSVSASFSSIMSNSTNSSLENSSTANASSSQAQSSDASVFSSISTSVSSESVSSSIVPTSSSAISEPQCVPNQPCFLFDTRYSFNPKSNSVIFGQQDVSFDLNPGIFEANPSLGNKYVCRVSLKVSGRPENDQNFGYEAITELLSGGSFVRDGIDTHVLADYDNSTGMCNLGLLKDNQTHRNFDFRIIISEVNSSNPLDVKKSFQAKPGYFMKIGSFAVLSVATE